MALLVVFVDPGDVGDVLGVLGDGRVVPIVEGRVNEEDDVLVVNDR